MKRLVHHSFTTIALLAALSAPLSFAQSPQTAQTAQSLSPRADPLLSVDMNRSEIVDRLMTQWQTDIAAPQRESFKQKLAGLRADRLLAVSLVGSFDGVLQVLYGQEKADQAAVARNALDRAKTLGDANIDLVYVPITPCRLIDTRTGQVSALGQLGGVFLPNTTRPVAPAGACGIPLSGVKNLFLSATTFNTTPNTGGYLAILPPGGAVTTVVDVFNFGSQWSSGSALVATGSAGQVDVVVAQATADVILDVVGYFRGAILPAFGTVTSITAGTGLTGGTITAAGTVGLANLGVGTAQIADASVTAAKLAASGCAAGQILKYSGSAWACAADDSGSVSGGAVGQVLTGTGAAPAWSGSPSLAGNLTLVNPSTSTSGNIMKGGSRFIHNAGFNNTFVGVDSGNFTVTGNSNTITGANALGNVTSGQSNTATGVFALNGNTSGSYNIALGIGAGGSLTTGDFNINIGNAGVAGESQIIRIGTSQTDTYLTGVVHGNGSGLTGVPAPASFTGQLAGDVLGPQTATVVALVGGVTAANVAAGANLANAATTANTAGTIVKRDASGNFSAGTISTTGGVKFADGSILSTAAPTVTGLSNSAGNTLTTVDSVGSVGQYTSITLGADGMPVISYYDYNNSNGHLKVAKCSNPACTGASTLTTVDSGGLVGLGTSITLGADGLPVISYFDVANNDLKVAKCSNPACTGASTLTTVDSVGNVGYQTSITLGADGLPVISYFDNTNFDLKVAKCSNPACTGASTLTTVDSGGNVGQLASITLGADGLPVISYWDLTNGDLKLAKCSNPACTGASTLTTVDSGGNVGQYSSITIGADGLPVISYYDVTNGDLKVAKCSSATCVPFVRRR